MIGPRRGLLLPAVVGIALAAAGCSAEPTLVGQRVVGHTGAEAVVLVDTPTREALTAGIDAYVRTNPWRVKAYSGTPSAIATSVKHGRPVDAVVLPAGPDLDRVRDELITAPVPVGRIGSTRYWYAVVTTRGLPLLDYLTSSAGANLLQSGGITP